MEANPGRSGETWILKCFESWGKTKNDLSESLNSRQLFQDLFSKPLSLTEKLLVLNE